MKILAIDGALNHSGWVLLDANDGSNWEGVISKDYGSIVVKKTLPLGLKLHYISQEMTRICEEYKPDAIVLEDVYSGINKKTVARLNNVKGVFILTAYNVLGKEPIYVGASQARSCLGFKNNKEEAYSFFRDKYKIKEENNDLTDAYVLAWWYVRVIREECDKSGKKTYARKRTRQKSNRQKQEKAGGEKRKSSRTSAKKRP
jgi:Holliday junction resolvasome RuvABC endonuclease subunit